ncbi:MAG: hypothetical protein ABIN74_06410 [Ferruginibacter sp.]
MKQARIIIVTILFSAFGFIQVNATDTTTRNATLPVELKLAGTFNSQPLVQLNFTGSTEDHVYNISITDEAGIELYNVDVKGDVFSKQFLLNTDDLGDAVLKFEITGKRSGKKAVYKVSRQQQYSEQMNVVKL